MHRYKICIDSGGVLVVMVSGEFLQPLNCKVRISESSVLTMGRILDLLDGKCIHARDEPVGNG